MAAPQTIVELIERFDRNRVAYKSDQYNEARLRIEFLNPFFEALGWDINNKQGYAEAYKDVIYEDAIKIGGATKAPDYCFRIGGTRKFFVEAKKPAINLKEASDPAFQLRRYAWSAKLPLSILTDFEEFAIYDCRVKPDREDRAATARVVYVICCLKKKSLTKQCKLRTLQAKNFHNSFNPCLCKKVHVSETNIVRPIFD